MTTDRPAMRIGISTPGVITLPGASSDWEEAMTPAELVAIARAADDLGFDHLTCSEHVGIPTAFAPTRGATYYDPVATLGYLAAVTTRIRLATSVIVLGYHHPLAVVKRFATIDRLSGGRVVLGVGVGSLAEEFDLLGADHTHRGPIADEAIDAIRSAWGAEAPTFHGERFDFDGFVIRPRPVQAAVPIWVGGRTRRSLTRAVTRADGWMPFGLDPAQLQQMIARVDLPEGFDLVLSPGTLDPVGHPDHATEALTELERVGATVAQVRLWSTDASHHLDQLAALATIWPIPGDREPAPSPEHRH